jgi:NADH dehydrogenase/NADH:ubiquinone oxidoreductase subunit G
MCNISIDGQEYKVEDSLTLLEACRDVGITIPTLCWLEGKSPLGACRVCLVEVEELPLWLPPAQLLCVREWSFLPEVPVSEREEKRWFSFF